LWIKTAPLPSFGITFSAKRPPLTTMKSLTLVPTSAEQHRLSRERLVFVDASALCSDGDDHVHGVGGVIDRLCESGVTCCGMNSVVQALLHLSLQNLFDVGSTISQSGLDVLTRA
jgi:hypothetical protein